METVLLIPPSASRAIHVNDVASGLEYVPYEVSELNITCHSVCRVIQSFVADIVLGG